MNTKDTSRLFKPKGSNNYWFDIHFMGVRHRKSTRTDNLANAKLYLNLYKSELQRAFYFKTPVMITENLAPKVASRPTVHVWEDAEVLYWEHTELTEFRSKETSRIALHWLGERLYGIPLNDITSDMIGDLIQGKLKERVKRRTVNRYLDVLKATLKLAHEKGWMASMPTINRPENEKGRLRWLTMEEWDRLKAELPHHLRQMARFAIVTGLRRHNITHLKWRDINWQTRQLTIHAEDAKGKRTYTIQLNDDAMAILIEQRGQHPTWVFTYRGQPVKYTKSTAWDNACIRAGIDVVKRYSKKKRKWVKTTTFVFHGLRHTWASWHVMNGTALKELQVLGGWRDLESVEVYVHLASHHLANVANNCKPISGGFKAPSPS